MAIYHAHVSSGSRDGGQSGAAKVAYLLREGKYAGRYDLVVSGHGNLPAWAGDDARALFTAADLYERANARLFVEVEVALPNELSEPQQQELVRAIAAAVTAPGLPFTYAIHAGRPKSTGEPANPHAHILLSERVNDGVPRDAAQWFRRANKKSPASGGAAKDRSLKERSWVNDTRQVIEGLINAHLTRAEQPERVTADSHATRIEKALAAGDNETAEFLRQHPPGVHLGPTLAALERDRFRQKQGEEPALSREGEPTDRGDLHRAIAGEAERLAKEMEADAEALGRARADLQRAEQAVAAARSAGLADEASLRVYEDSESVAGGTGWTVVEAATATQVERKQQAEAVAGQWGIDVEAVYRTARERGSEPVSALEEATGIFASARSAALLTDEEIAGIHAEAESREGGGGWAAVEEETRSRLVRKTAVEAAARAVGVEDIGAVYAAAMFCKADPVAALEAETGRRRAEAERRVARQLREQRRTKLFQHPDGKSLYYGKLDELAPAWRQTGRALGKHIDQALEHGEATQAARARQAYEERERRLAAGLALLRDRRCEGVSVGGEWLYSRKLEDLERGRRQSSPARREEALAWAERQIDRLDSLRENDGLDLFVRRLDKIRAAALFFRKLEGAAQRPEAIEEALDDAEEQLRQAAERRQTRIDALSKDARIVFDMKLEALDRSWRETGTAQPVNIDAALDYARTQLDALDQDIERRRADIHETPGDGYARLLQAGFESESRHRKVQALTTVESYLHEDLDRQEAKVRTHAAGEDFLRRGRVEVLGADRQPETLSDRCAVIGAAKAHLQQAATARREAQHQMVSATPGGDARLRAGGWEEARTDSARDRILTTVEHDLVADCDRHERRLLTDSAGEALLRRGRLEVLAADREAETLAERGRVLQRAEALRQAADTERKRRQEVEQRVARLKRLFAVAAGDAVFFTALDAQKPTWRQQGTVPADIDRALEAAEPRLGRTKASGPKHAVIIEAEQEFADTPSAAWRQAGARFPKTSTHARAMSQRLSDRALAQALAAERTEPPASLELVQQLFTWLRAQVEKLLQGLGLVKPVTRQSAPASGAAQPAPPVLTPERAPAAPSAAAVDFRALNDALAEGLEEEALPRVDDQLAVSNATMAKLMKGLDAEDGTDGLARRALIALRARHLTDAEERGRAEFAYHETKIRAAIVEDKREHPRTLTVDEMSGIAHRVINDEVPAIVARVRRTIRTALPVPIGQPPNPEPSPGRAAGTAATRERTRPERGPGR